MRFWERLDVNDQDFDFTSGALFMAQSLYKFAFLLTLVAFLALGCGPTQATIKISESEVAFEKASLVEAETKAPFEYFSAKAFLHKAKEEWGYSNFEKSAEYAILAKQFSDEALRKAKGIEKKSSPSVPGSSRPLKKRKTSDPDADALEGLAP